MVTRVSDQDPDSPEFGNFVEFRLNQHRKQKVVDWVTTPTSNGYVVEKCSGVKVKANYEKDTLRYKHAQPLRPLRREPRVRRHLGVGAQVHPGELRRGVAGQQHRRLVRHDLRPGRPPLTGEPAAEPAAVPAALAEPSVAPPTRWVALLALASVGLWAGFFGPIQVLLAQQAESLDAANKEQVLALVAGVGALVSVICNPLAGAFSDRTTLRAGRRLPWLVGGAVGGALSLVVLSVAPNVPVMLLGWCGVQATLNAMLAAVTAMIPDQVPSNRRGRIGGIVAVAQTVGVVAGTGIAAATGSIAAGYLTIAGVPDRGWRCRSR